CPAPPRTDFADNAIVLYPLGTKLYYECDDGYTRRSGQYTGIRCQCIEGVASWIYTDFECIDIKILLSTSPTLELDFTQMPGRKEETSAPQKQENLPEFYQKGFCGTPKTVPHAYLKLKKQYHLGQVLLFKCLEGFDKQHPISGTRTCKKVNGQITWTSLYIQCTNNS
ncbi:IL2RA protein, partial [Heliornis fulica]|nr:IL2RA protein [Heliornis fulica]